MYSTTETRSKIMRAIKGKNTKPEMAIRKGLHALGYRFRLHVRQLPGSPDLVFPRFGAAIEVRGCFWHGHSCRHGHVPQSNASYWAGKLARNKERDARNLRLLRRAGYRVKVVWECQVDTETKRAAVFKRLANWLEKP